MKLKRFLLITVLTFIFLVRCGQDTKSTDDTDYSKPLSWGKFDEVQVFSDDKIWKYTREKLKNNIERLFYTTYNEKMFNLKRKKISNVKGNYRFANLLFFCNVNSNKPVSKYIKEILPKQTAAISDSSPVKLIAAKDFWAQNQTVVFILGKDFESVVRHTYKNLNRLFEIYKHRLMNRLENLVYRPGVNEKEIKYESKNYPWTIKLPKGYIVFKRDNENNFVSYLLRVEGYPDRFLAVYWEKMDKDKVTKKWLWNKRKWIGKEYYVGDIFYERDVTQRKIDFKKYDAYKLYGRWQNPDNYTGGAFSSYAFYDEEQDRAYLIDNMVYFPKGDKLKALMEMEIISKTFKTKKGINKK